MKKDARREKQLARKFLHHEGEQAGGAVAELLAVAALMEENPWLSGFLGGPQFSVQEKKGLLARLAAEKTETRQAAPLSEGTRAFLEYLVEKDAAALLPGIARSAEALQMEHARRARAVVVSARGLDGAAGRRLKDALGKITGREVEVIYEQDPSILGGVMVKIGSMMFDSSISGQLRRLKEELIKG